MQLASKCLRQKQDLHLHCSKCGAHDEDNRMIILKTKSSVTVTSSMLNKELNAHWQLGIAGKLHVQLV